MTWRWYLSIAAIQEWMEATGRGGIPEDSNPNFVAAERELGELSLTARLVDEPPGTQRSGSLCYRGNITIVDGQRIRVECRVMPARREEGNLPQLVRVRRKHRGRR
jgi:hypothetical protein